MTDPKAKPHHDEAAWVLAVLLGWAVPGLGHLFLGRRNKAAVFFVCIGGLFVVGWGLGQWRCVNYNDTLLFLGQSLAGVLGFVAGAIGGRLVETVSPLNPVPVAAEMGSLYTLVAGFLNLLVMVDAFMVANNIQRPHQQQAAEGGSK